MDLPNKMRLNRAIDELQGYVNTKAVLYEGLSADMKASAVKKAKELTDSVDSLWAEFGPEMTEAEKIKYVARIQGAKEPEAVVNGPGNLAASRDLTDVIPQSRKDEVSPDIQVSDRKSSEDKIVPEKTERLDRLWPE